MKEIPIIDSSEFNPIKALYWEGQCSVCGVTRVFTGDTKWGIHNQTEHEGWAADSEGEFYCGDCNIFTHDNG